MMKTKNGLVQFNIIVILILGLSACDLPTETPPTLTPPPPPPSPTADLPVTFTHVAETHVAMTQHAFIANLAPTLTPTATPPCEAVEFKKLTPSTDRTILGFDQTAQETWQLKNVGACTWTTQYRVGLIKDEDQHFGSQKSYNLPNNVPAGGTVDISIDVATGNIYEYLESAWVLYNSAGQIVNRPNTADPTFKVKIIASDAKHDFVREACSDETVWSSSSSKELSCPGQLSDNQGFVLPRTYFRSTIISTEDEANAYHYGLLMSPGNQNDGSISGTYPVMEIKRNYRFRALVGCLYKESASNCNIRFQVTALSNIPGEPSKILAELPQVADGALGLIDVDLASFVGQKVQLVLTVITNGIASDNTAFWFAPRIVADR